jgi:hypothetical protein
MSHCPKIGKLDLIDPLATQKMRTAASHLLGFDLLQSVVNIFGVSLLMLS